MEDSPLPNRGKVDIQQIKRWLHTCKNTHGEHCNSRYTELLSDQLPTLNLIDVSLGALVTLPSSTPFVALSYVWGDVPIIKTKADNEHLLRSPGYLSRSEVQALIPDTIRDAMYLVKEFGERYLWVDCLCIVQDAGEEEMHSMLRAMARIYASAEFTIVAASGHDANAGLRGIGGPSQDRDEEMMMAVMERHGYPWDSKWASRGWTFQESLFSRRLLVFEGELSWMCGRCIWLEDGDDSLFTDDVANDAVISLPKEREHLGIPMGMMSILPTIPSLGRWAMLIENYSKRSLTLEDDIGRAFAGATDVMSGTFPGGIFYGLPEFFFDIALLWQPTTSIHRRTGGGPSWSWAGWHCGVDCLQPWYPFFPGVFRETNQHECYSPIAILKQTALFSKLERHRTNGPQPANLQTTPIDNGFHDYQAFRNTPSRPLPSTWHRHEENGSTYFTHSLDEKRYSYPLPTASSFPARPNLPFSYILQCTGPLAILHFGRIHADDNRPVVVELTTADAKIVGSLVLHSHPAPDVVQSAECELLAISEAEVLDVERMQEELLWYSPVDAREDCQLGNQLSEGFYHVLWIGWESDVAVRKGLGRVAKRAWDGLGARMSTFKLG